MYTTEEIALIEYVNTQINMGKRKIVVPAELLKNVRESAKEEVIRLCKLNGVKIEVIY